jgi:hypothetical protein
MTDTPRALTELHIACASVHATTALVIDAGGGIPDTVLPDLSGIGVVVVLNVRLIDMPRIDGFELLAAYPSTGPKTTDLVLGRRG